MNTPLIKWAVIFTVVVLAQHFVFKNLAWDSLKNLDKAKITSTLSTLLEGDKTTWTAIEEEESIPLEWHGVWMARVQLNNLYDAKLIIDSGATITMLSAELAFDLGLSPSPYLPTIPISTANGQIEAWGAKIESIQVGEVERTNLPVAVTDFGDQSENNIDGLLGLNFLDGFDWRLDHANGRLILKEKS